MRATKAVQLALSAGQHATDVEVVVQRPAGTIQGTVTGQDGAPIADAWVAVHHSLQDQLHALSACDDESHCKVMGSAGVGSDQAPPALTNAQGHFALMSNPPTERARQACGSPRMKPRPSTFPWSQNGTVTGRVVDKAGKPISGMGVALIPDQPPGRLDISLHETPPSSGPDGRFQVAGPPGTRTLLILSREPTVKRGVSVAAGNTIDVGDMTVDKQQRCATEGMHR